MLCTPPLSLYVHFPWCVRKCPYCDFNSHALNGELPSTAYVAALLADLDRQQQQFSSALEGRAIHSVFFGGGTPSLFDPSALHQLLLGLRARLPLTAETEITLEANPGTIERGRFAGYRAAGITRVSLGAQSFDALALQSLGRIHSAEETATAVAELRQAGLENFNLDLMYGLPRQTLRGALADLEAALALGPAHVSHYQLTLEPGTVFGGRPPSGMPEDELALEMQLACQSLLATSGFSQYEVSAYAQPGRQCLHNRNYWQFGDYLGVGAGAHGKLTDATHDAIYRTQRTREPRRYLASAASALPDTQRIAAMQLPFEFMLNALRLNEGFTVGEFESRTGQPFSVAELRLERLRDRGLLEHRGASWRASTLGLRFLNEVLTEFVPETPSRPKS